MQVFEDEHDVKLAHLFIVFVPHLGIGLRHSFPQELFNSPVKVDSDRGESTNGIKVKDVSLTLDRGLLGQFPALCTWQKHRPSIYRSTRGRARPRPFASPFCLLNSQ